MSKGNAIYLSSSHNGGGIVNTRVHPLSHSVPGSLQTAANELRDRLRVSRWNGSNLVCIYSPLSCQASTVFLPLVFFVAALKTSVQRLSGLSREKNWKRQGWRIHTHKKKHYGSSETAAWKQTQRAGSGSLPGWAAPCGALRSGRVELRGDLTWLLVTFNTRNGECLMRRRLL